MSTAGLVDRFLGWIYDALTRRLERKRKETEETRERLVKAHSILTSWSAYYPQFVELIGLMRQVTFNDKMVRKDKDDFLDSMKKPLEEIGKLTPDLSQFIADNYLLLPTEIGKRLKEIHALGNVTQVLLGQEDGKKKAEAIRQKCKELMDLIERDYFDRSGRK